MKWDGIFKWGFNEKGERKKGKHKEKGAIQGFKWHLYFKTKTRVANFNFLKIEFSLIGHFDNDFPIWYKWPFGILPNPKMP